MAERLGETLISRGVINDQQLVEALRAQTIFGGRLGTNLIELGFISETDLSRHLGFQHNISSAQPHEFEKVSGEALDAIPGELAQKYQVFPLSIQNRTVRLAVADPTAFGALDDISFATGLRIVPVVAPEVMIVYALERYYEIPRSMRYIRLSPHALRKVGSEDSNQDGLDTQPVAQVDGENQLHGARMFYLKDAVEKLATAETIDELLWVFEQYVSEDFERVALFEVNQAQLKGISQLGCKLTSEEFVQISTPCIDHPLCQKVFQSKTPFVGVLETNSADTWLLEILGFSISERVFCLPIVVKDRVAYLMLAAGPKDRELLEVASDYRIFSKKLGYGFEYLLARNKILETPNLQ